VLTDQVYPPGGGNSHRGAGGKAGCKQRSCQPRCGQWAGTG
jgi:hypothetical protein